MVSMKLRPKDDLSNINYDYLASKYQMYKYYPKYFHNEELKTPDIKCMILDKPIYSKANEHIEDYINPGVMKIYETELDLDSGKLKITKEKKDKADERKLKRDERRDERKERKYERKISLQDKLHDKHQDLRDKEQIKHMKRKEKYENKRKLLERKKLIESKEKPKPIEFNNPFSPIKETVYNSDIISNFSNETSYSIGSNNRKNSITSRIASLLSNTTDDNTLERINSFDQTKSSLTNSRKKFFAKKRYSDQIGMYFFY